ncbi:CPA1 family monovalent cation:H+ antiporter [Antricoccus suffuscus]|uniref:CPA1 family monovalent cation:H+ antiporter n=1 Tax=Antricoccus suffuscus TaxID=1629062 RepID=A0A2T1A6P0_9ACTN|nr:sodium:proton antiporter [Antricoccus suffuscus]PRZ44260.1 CPA1 family monovalent cation:H+ antiporter [Antricoccus suffuscus]
MPQLWPVIGLVAGVIIVNGLASRLRIAAPVLLVLIGFGVSFIPGVPSFTVSPDVILFILLPPLLYAAGMESSIIAFKKLLRPILQLAVVAVILTAVVVGLIVHAVVPAIPFPVALALGAVVAPPDAVAAVAVARKVGLPRSVVTLLEGESLFNDATSLVMLKVAVTAIGVGTFGSGAAVGEFATSAAIGLAVGAILGVGVSWARNALSNSLSITALSLITPFVAYLLGEQLHGSGVLAVVVAGLIVGFTSATHVSGDVRIVEGATFATLRYVLEGAVFALIGLQLWDIVRSVQESAGTALLAAVTTLLVVVLSRPLWVYGGDALSRLFRREHRLEPRKLAVVSWAGMRGVVSLAAAQTLPLDTPHRDLILLCTVVVIFGTLVLQGPTLPWFARIVGVHADDPETAAIEVRRARHEAMAGASEIAHAALDQHHLPAPARLLVERWLKARGAEASVAEADRDLYLQYQDTINHVRRDIIASERATYIRLRNNGKLSEGSYQQIERDLDLEESGLIRRHNRRGHQNTLIAEGTDDETDH